MASNPLDTDHEGLKKRSPKPRADKKREMDKAIAKDKDSYNGWDTDKVHGDGEDIGIEDGSKD
jgi:hypothetical protein